MTRNGDGQGGAGGGCGGDRQQPNTNASSNGGGRGHQPTESRLKREGVAAGGAAARGRPSHQSQQKPLGENAAQQHRSEGLAPQQHHQQRQYQQSSRNAPQQSKGKSPSSLNARAPYPGDQQHHHHRQQNQQHHSHQIRQKPLGQNAARQHRSEGLAPKRSSRNTLEQSKGKSPSCLTPPSPFSEDQRHQHHRQQQHQSQRQSHLSSGGHALSRHEVEELHSHAKREHDLEAGFHQEGCIESASPTALQTHDHRIHKPFYSPPQQIQRWGETASHPHVDWGGLFFDLFYVAAAYNLGSVYISAIDDVEVQEERPLFLYVIAAFGAIWMTWYNTVAYDARFSVLDYAHRILHVLRILAISLSIVHIKSFNHFSNPLDPTMFFFVFGLFLESLINLVMWVEIWGIGRGGPELKQEAKFTVLLFVLPQVVLYMAATSIAGINCFSNDAGQSNYRSLGAEKDTNATLSIADDRPIWLVFAAYVLYQITALLWSIFLPRKKLREKYCVPINADFFIHRLGEWVMLMLGESVLSLLIVGLSEEREYYIIVLVGILTVVMLQDLHFESQPSDPNAHAISKTRAGNAYILLIQGYSLALIFLGASYKYMLDLLNHKGAYDKEKDGGSYETDGGSYPNEEVETDEGSHRSRLLGGSIVDPEDAQKSKEYVVWMYCISMVVILLSLEFMLASHQGFPWKRWLSSKHGVQKPWKRGLQALMAITKIALLTFFAVYATNSTLLSYPVSDVTFSGGAIVLIFLVMRVVDWEVLQSDSNEGETGRVIAVDPHHTSHTCSVSK